MKYSLFLLVLLANFFTVETWAQTPMDNLSDSEVVKMLRDNKFTDGFTDFRKKSTNPAFKSLPTHEQVKVYQRLMAEHEIIVDEKRRAAGQPINDIKYIEAERMLDQLDTQERIDAMQLQLDDLRTQLEQQKAMYTY